MEKAFFLTKAELQNSIREFEKKTPLKYVRAGIYDVPEVEEYEGIDEISTFGLNKTGSQDEVSYLILKDREMVNLREVKAERGYKFEIELKDNPTAVKLIPGGTYKYKDLIAGKLIYLEDDKTEADFKKALTETILKDVKSTKNFYVGKDALKVKSSGGKLIINNISEEESFEI